ncbi:MAG: hypothetical protein UMV23_02040 [Halanaerobium sp.]|nr:hypothetical protein [Halanaerobium sp.]
MKTNTTAVFLILFFFIISLTGRVAALDLVYKVPGMDTVPIETDIAYKDT